MPLEPLTLLSAGSAADDASTDWSDGRENYHDSPVPAATAAAMSVLEFEERFEQSWEEVRKSEGPMHRPKLRNVLFAI